MVAPVRHIPRIENICLNLLLLPNRQGRNGESEQMLTHQTQFHFFTALDVCILPWVFVDTHCYRTVRLCCCSNGTVVLYLNLELLRTNRIATIARGIRCKARNLEVLSHLANLKTTNGNARKRHSCLEMRTKLNLTRCNR